MLALIVAETAIFMIFVVAYIYYIGKSISGPQPRQVLELPIFNTVCLLSSSFTIWLAERALKKSAMGAFNLWWALTVVLGATFLGGTGLEWKKLIYHDGLTISTNLFGTTFYSLVGLHASHVIIGLTMLSLVLLFSLAGKVKSEHAKQLEVLSLYWHFVDGVWVVVFTVVYIIGR
jgi:cytochrome c oxidase subunit 3/cytochrome o ubiquinol oxidase subunit 3